MKGVYILIIEIPQDLHLIIKALGKLCFEKGTWLYVGSAMGSGSTSLENRIARHFRKEKRIHWHIDILLHYSTNLQTAVWAESDKPMECKVVESIESMQKCTSGPKGFGASDCKSNCTSHLFYCQNGKKVQDMIQTIFTKLGLEPRITLDGLLCA